ncbi:hypothetical protein [Candidatus Chloroploca asiatica]|uniref:Bacterial transcriptional activator domain-containing protein n=1 Tax=Candidatus Chloroploca asiatica TaxID=1506545 RepID=A0A2H3KG90_9CHLR|nr:hypothetical protein [Candidatus Chloroploca asiatica]PDV96723.1 hypothetical protein A9Q02_05720 [Candidatus Chloroploca asiatica]
MTAGLKLGEIGGQGYPIDQAWIFEARCLRARLLTSLGEVDEAAAIYADCLAWYAEHADRYGLLLCLRGIAVLAQRQGYVEDAACLAAAAEHLGEVIEAPVWPVYREAHQAWLAELRGALSVEQCAVFWSEGTAASLEPAALERLASAVLDRARAALQREVA